MISTVATPSAHFTGGIVRVGVTPGCHPGLFSNQVEDLMTDNWERPVRITVPPLIKAALRLGDEEPIMAEVASVLAHQLNAKVSTSADLASTTVAIMLMLVEDVEGIFRDGPPAFGDLRAHEIADSAIDAETASLDGFGVVKILKDLGWAGYFVPKDTRWNALRRPALERLRLELRKSLFALVERWAKKGVLTTPEERARREQERRDAATQVDELGIVHPPKSRRSPSAIN
jgi:hypothetical protein